MMIGLRICLRRPIFYVILIYIHLVWERIMEHLPNGYTLEIPQGCFPLSTDSMLLQHFVRLPRNARVLDLGSGCATLGTLLCARDTSCHVTGVELDPKAHADAQDQSTQHPESLRKEHLLHTDCQTRRCRSRQAARH